MRPKNTKKIAAKRSRSGVSTWLAFAATRPDSAMPTRNAPTAADTLTCGREARDEHREAEHAEQQRLVLVGGEEARHDVPVPQRDVEDDGHDARRRSRPRSRPAAGSRR